MQRRRADVVEREGAAGIGGGDRGDNCCAATSAKRVVACDVVEHSAATIVGDMRCTGREAEVLLNKVKGDTPLVAQRVERRVPKLVDR